MAARASMTDEAPVAFLKTSMSPWLFTRSREPPLQEAHGGKTHHITCCGWNQGPGTRDLEPGTWNAIHQHPAAAALKDRLEESVNIV